MARSNDVLVNVHVLTDDDSKSWVEETILNVIGRHLTEGIVFGFENNNVTLQRKYLGGKVYQEVLLFKFFSQMLMSSPAPLTESYWIQWRSSLGKIVWAVKKVWMNSLIIFCVQTVMISRIHSAQAKQQGSGDRRLGPTSTDLLPWAKAWSWTECAKLRWDGDACDN